MRAATTFPRYGALLAPAEALLRGARSLTAAARRPGALPRAGGSSSGGGGGVCAALAVSRRPARSSRSPVAASASRRGRAQRNGGGDGARLLEAGILRCESLEQLQALVQHPGAALAPAQAAGAIHKLVQLAARSKRLRESSQQLAGQLEALLLVPGQLRRCSPEQLARTAWCCGQMSDQFSAALPAACISELLQQQQPQQFSATQLAMVLQGAAKCAVQLPAQHVQQLVAVLLQPHVLTAASSQVISNSLWLAATAQQQLPARQVQQLVAALADGLPQASAPAISKTLWAVAAMQRRLPAQHAQLLVAGLVEKLRHANAQQVGSVLWAVAQMGQQLPERHEQQLVAALASTLYGRPAQTVDSVLQQLPAKQLRSVVTYWIHDWSLVPDPSTSVSALKALASKQQQPPGEQQQQQGGELVAQLVAAVVQERQRASVCDIADTLLAAAALRQRLLPHDVAQLLDALLERLQEQLQWAGAPADTQALANALVALARMQYDQPERVQQLLAALAAEAAAAQPRELAQAITAAIRSGAAALMPGDELQQLLVALVAKRQQAGPGDAASALLAAVIMQPVGLATQQQVHQLVGVVARTLQQAEPGDVATTLLACARLHYLPSRLLAALEAQPQLAQQLVGGMAAQQLASTAWACAHLGHSGGSTALVDASVQRAAQQLQSGGITFTCSQLCSLAWAAAVLDRRGSVEALLQLVRACRQQWRSMAADGFRELHYVHEWLLRAQLADDSGLLGPLTHQQLQQCAAAWDAR